MAGETFQQSAAWDARAADYETSAEPYTRQYAAYAMSLAGGLSPDEAVIDIAAGTGALALQAAETGAAVLATDFSPGMVRRLEERIRDGGFAPASRAQVMNGQALEVPDATCDAAFCIFGVMMFPDPPRGLAEMRRVLKPGGRAVVATWADPGGGGPSPLFFDAFREAAPGRALPGFPPYAGRWTDPSLFRADVAAAGFASVEVSAWTGLWTLPSVEEAKSSMVRFFGQQPTYAELSPREQAAVTETFAGRLRTAADGRVLIDSTAHFAVARA